MEKDHNPRDLNRTQHLLQLANREGYDPDQDHQEKRWLRREYRELYTQTEDNKHTIVNNSDGLIDILGRANELYRKVKNTHEAALDSKVLMLSSQLGQQRAQNILFGYGLFQPETFVEKLITTMGGRQVRAQSAHTHQHICDWRTIGSIATKYVQRAPAMDFILGPLSVEHKDRKTSRTVRQEKNKADLVRPEELKEGDIERVENETTRNVMYIAQLLEQVCPINFFEFIVNPESFSQTIENLFYLSFLIRDAMASIEEENGQLILCRVEKPTAEDYALGLEKKQLIMDLDMQTWRDMIEAYNITKPVIPTRSSTAANLSSKWYG
ncbi:uncharacterized protein VTP21DRAFT_3905 [Calcarisporiella thermophila]|uniref:uncharacterized protein n=1 Tax=Calcarisporiella thermophila TaxID=911321 RepID=UPI0037420F2F